MRSLELVYYFTIVFIIGSEFVQCKHSVNNDIFLSEKTEKFDYLSWILESPWGTLLPKANEDQNYNLKRLSSSTSGGNKIPGDRDNTNIYSSIFGGRRYTRQTNPGYSSSNSYFNTYVSNVKPSYGDYNNSKYNQQWNYISTSTYPTNNPVSVRPIYQSSSDTNRFLYNSNYSSSLNSVNRNNFNANNPNSNYYSGYKVNNSNVKLQFNNNSFNDPTYSLHKASNSTKYNTRNGAGTIANVQLYNSYNLNPQVTYPSYGINNSHKSFGQKSRVMANHSYWNQYPNVNLNRNSFSQAGLKLNGNHPLTQNSNYNSTYHPYGVNKSHSLGQGNLNAKQGYPNYNPIGGLILNGQHPLIQNSNYNSTYHPYGVNKSHSLGRGNLNANQGYPNYNPVGGVILNDNHPLTQNSNYKNQVEGLILNGQHPSIQNSNYTSMYHPYGVNKTQSIRQGDYNANQGYPYQYSNYGIKSTIQYNNYNKSPNNNKNYNPLDPSKYVAINTTFPATYPGYEPYQFYHNPTTDRPIYDPRKNPPQNFSY